jgi:hypothetical protein
MAGRTPQHDDGAALRTLLAIVDRAIALQDRADAVLFGCAVDGEPSTRVAREGGAVAGEYQRLWEWSHETAPDADPRSLEGRISALLMAHCQAVHLAIRFAFPRYRTERSEEQRQKVTRLGGIAPELRSLREELRMWIVMDGGDPGDEEPPDGG